MSGSKNIYNRSETKREGCEKMENVKKLINIEKRTNAISPLHVARSKLKAACFRISIKKRGMHRRRFASSMLKDMSNEIKLKESSARHKMKNK